MIGRWQTVQFGSFGRAPGGNPFGNATGSHRDGSNPRQPVDHNTIEGEYKREE